MMMTGRDRNAMLLSILTEEMTMDKKLVAYFSAGGRTAKVAEKLAAAIGAGLY